MATQAEPPAAQSLQHHQPDVPLGYTEYTILPTPVAFLPHIVTPGVAAPGAFYCELFQLVPPMVAAAAAAAAAAAPLPSNTGTEGADAHTLVTELVCY
jgi:hypothetical protein